MVRKRVTIENYMKARKNEQNGIETTEKTVRFNKMIPCQPRDFPFDT